LKTIAAYVELRATAQPDAPYLIAPETGAVLTYAELGAASQRLAAFLAARGLAKGDKVALMLHNGYQTARLLIGVMYAGCTVAPLNLLSQRSQLGYVLEHSDTKLVFTSAELEPRLREALEGIARPIDVVVIDPDATGIEADAAVHAPFDSASLRSGQSGKPRSGRTEGEDEALLMYTSGTTGVPKGVMHTHRSVVAGGVFTSDAHRLGANDRVLCALPLYHINGQIVTTVAPLVHGGSVVMPHRFSAGSYWQLAADHRCTWLNVVPTIIAYLLNGPGPRELGLDVSRVKFCRSASAPLPPELHRAFEERFGIGVIETFGMTETNAPCFTNPYEPERRKIGSPGRAFGNEAKVVDVATGIDQPAGVPGEIMVRGENVMKCYYKDAAATVKAIEPDGWMHTGDLGLLDADGYLFVTGRLKELIIKGGENIAPREIDEALLKHPAVLEAAAVGMPDATYGQEILACVVLKSDCECTPEEIIAHAHRELGRYKSPKVVRIVEALPKGPSGKVQRLKLLQP
jgi:acyl-CoA synthetase (AMP-forming)/AMP-acid ligase II